MDAESRAGAARILLVEDDDEIAALIARYLGREGYEVERARDGRSALDSFRSGGHSLLILDLMLPRIGGLDVLRHVRHAADVPVIILSCRGEEADKVAGLGLGADDYMTKPFSMPELAARVKAQLRRYAQAGGRTRAGEPPRRELMTVLDLELDPERMTVSRGGEDVGLTPTEFEILKLLMSDPGRVYAKSRIIDAVWGQDGASEENNIAVHMSNIRRKLGDDSANPRYIQTVWGIGYRLREEGTRER